MINFIQNEGRKSVILFIHGFTGGSETWKHPDHESFPKLLLTIPEISAAYDIACFEYYTKASILLNTASNLIARLKKAVLRKSHDTLKTIVGVEEITELLRTSIRVQLKQYDEIIIVSHSMGGLIGKCCIVKDSEAGLSSKISLLVTLATPHLGSNLATFGKLISPNMQGADLVPLNTFIAKLSDSWLKIKKRPTAKYLYGTHDGIVPKTSAVPADYESLDFMALDENHESICKPQGVTSTSFMAVQDIIVSHKATKKIEHLSYQSLEDDEQYNNELFVLKLIIADIKNPAIRNAKEVFLNSEYMRKLFNNDADWKKIEHLYDKVRKIYSDRYISFIHGGIKNSGVLLSEVHEKILEEDAAFLACVASGVDARHKQGMLHQLANNPDGDIWWTEETGMIYLEEEIKKK